MKSKYFYLEIEFQPDLNLEMLYATHTLSAFLPLCEASQKSMKRISRYLGTSTKRIQIMHELKTGLYADKIATFGCSEKGSITHSFCKLPL